MSFMKVSLPSPMVWKLYFGCGAITPIGYFLKSGL